MRSESLSIQISNPNEDFNFKSFLDSNQLDYEKDSNTGKWKLYYHFDDIFPYNIGILNFMDKIQGVVNTFPEKKGIYNDYIELYYEVSKSELNEDIDWFEWEGLFYQNVSFQLLNNHIGKDLRLKQEIIQGTLQ